MSIRIDCNTRLARRHRNSIFSTPRSPLYSNSCIAVTLALVWPSDCRQPAPMQRHVDLCSVACSRRTWRSPAARAMKTTFGLLAAVSLAAKQQQPQSIIRAARQPCRATCSPVGWEAAPTSHHLSVLLCCQTTQLPAARQTQPTLSA